MTSWLKLLTHKMLTHKMPAHKMPAHKMPAHKMPAQFRKKVRNTQGQGPYQTSIKLPVDSV